MGRKAPVLEAFDRRTMPEPNTGCWLWIGAERVRGYGYFRGSLAHRAAYELFIGPIPEGMHILHSCDTPGCVNPDHLRPGTHQDNMADASKRRRFHVRHHKNYYWLGKVGEQHARSILTDVQARSILVDPRRICEIAKELGVSWSTVDAVRKGRNWKHLQDSDQEKAA